VVNTASAFRALLFCTTAVWLLVELRQWGSERPEAVNADRGSRRVLVSALAIGFAGAFLAARVASGAAIRPMRVADWVGLIVMWCGIGLRFWSFRTLGRYFTFCVETSADQPVITVGPYKVIRHPGYAGILVALAGVGVLFGNWLSLVSLIVSTLCGLVYRMSVEERALTRTTGPAYGDYAATHKRLVPFIW
jgi:protein-S-isoprenylcysteine O-methyltransferase Ste14